MAPTAIYDTSAPAPSWASLPVPLSKEQFHSQAKADPTRFPDGLKTSGQHPPVESLIRPYSAFPKEISGRTVWLGEEFQDHPEKWTRVFTPEEIEEIGTAADDFIGSDVPLTGITKDLYPLPKLAGCFAELRDEIYNGRGFILFKGLPVREWGLKKSATAYMGLGTYFGYFTSQNGKGHVLGHVKDLGEDPTKTDRVRIYRTNARQFFHTDASDLVGLLCIARSLEGGESDIASTHAMFNYLQANHPDVVETLVTPHWYFDRKGEVSTGQLPYYRSCPLFLENVPEQKSQGNGAGNGNGAGDAPGSTSGPRVYGKFDPYFVKSLSRFQSGPEAILPPLSPAQLHAVEIFEATANKLKLHMILEPGDIQLLANTHIFHARTAYKDWPAGSVDENGHERVRRHLMRLWLATPEQEGGWRLAHPDSRQKKRGGMQIDDVAPTCPLDAE